MVTKPYHIWVATVPLSTNFRIPDFKMFDGIGNSNQQIVFFVKMVFVKNGPPITKDAVLLQLFVQSLEGASFT